MSLNADAANQCQNVFKPYQKQIDSLVEVMVPAIEKTLYSQQGSQTGDPKYDKAKNPFQELKPEYLPDNAELAEVALEVNRIFQNKKIIASFLKYFYQRVLEDVAEKEGSVGLKQITEQAGLIQSRKGLATLFKLCEEVGWPKPVQVDRVYSESVFWKKVVGPAIPFYDAMLAREKHSASAHLLQLVIAKPLIDQKFGPEAFTKLLKYMGNTPEGGYLWGYLFDVPYNRRDIREPGSFSRMGFVGPDLSLLGLD